LGLLDLASRNVEVKRFGSDRRIDVCGRLQANAENCLRPRRSLSDRQARGFEARGGLVTLSRRARRRAELTGVGVAERYPRWAPD